MSYGSIFLQFEANGRISQKFSRPSFKKDLQDHPVQLVNFEKEFDVNCSRAEEMLPNQHCANNSMIAYSKKMRTLQDARCLSRNVKHGPLFVRTKHIPKHPVKAPQKRRPMSFDELIGRDRETAKTRPHSDKIKPVRDGESKTENEMHIPLLSERLRKSNQKVQVSLVSASDLYEIVDFSLRSKGVRNDSLQMLRMEREEHPPRDEQYKKPHGDPYGRFISENTYGKFERSPETLKKLRWSDQKFLGDSETTPNKTDTNLYHDNFSLDTISDDSSKGVRFPSIYNDSFKRRPNRARRMKLTDPGLGDIPEDNLIEFDNSAYQHQHISPLKVNSPTLIWQLSNSKSLDANAKTSLDVIQERVERVNVNDSSDINEQVSDDTNAVFASSLPDLALLSDVELHTLQGRRYRGIFSQIDEATSTRKVLQDDGDVRIEVTQCPPKQDIANTKMKAQKQFKKLILRDTPR